MTRCIPTPLRICAYTQPSLIQLFQPFCIVTEANCLNDYFASISTVNDEHTPLPPFAKLTDNSLSEINCTEYEIETIIEVLNPNKASGDDGISHKMLKGVSKSVSKPLCILMNRSFSEGIFPDTWKLANVIPILKREINLNLPITGQ